ncbi:MAG: hypothetical protein IPM54_20855 [Polyangiaceae bacterium]|nr:hypothetical protein [Polyangiaceae bacterium]
MSAYAGSLVPVTEPYLSLAWIPLVLLLGALIVTFSAGRLEPQRRRAVALVSIGMALGLLALHAVQLAMLDSARRALRDVTTNLVRIGSLDANLGFFLDPAAAFLLFVPLVGTAFFLTRTKFAKKNDGAGHRFQAAVLLLAAGVSTALLADGFVVLLFGWSLAAVATYVLVVRDKRLSVPVATATRVFLLQFAGIASLLAAFVLLFWSLGGAWLGDGYLSDYRARFVAVHARDMSSGPEEVVVPDDIPRGERDAAAVAQRAKERGTLTFTSHPGARVFVDTGDKLLERAEPFGVAPFVRKDIPAGPHDIVIVPGGGAIVTGDGHEVAWIERLVVGNGEDVSVVPVGQASTFSEVADQLELVDDQGKHFLRNALFNKKFFGFLGVVPLVVFLIALGALLTSVPALLVPWLVPGEASPSWNVLRISAVVLGLHPLVRAGDLVSFNHDVVVIACVLAAVLVGVVRTRRPSLLLGSALLLVAAMFVLPTDVHASEGGEPRMVLRPERGDVVELDYAPDGETMVGAFVIRNDGTAALKVSGARLRFDADAPRSPPFATVEIEGAKGGAVVVDPGKERRVVVRWRFGDARAREFFGHAFVEANAPSSPSLVPIHASRSRDLGPLGDRALSFIVWFPLVAAFLALVLRAIRRDGARTLAVASALVFAANLAFVIAMGARFDRQFGRADGNDGLQLVERAVLLPNIGVEYFLGLDGVSLTLVVVMSLVAPLASLASASLRDRPVWFHVFGPIFVTSVLGVFVSQDIVLFCGFWFVGIVAAYWLIRTGTGEGARVSAMRFGISSLAGMVFLGASAYWLHRHSDPTYAVDGRFLTHALAIPDLARVNWVNVDASLFGVNAIKVIWTALFFAFGLRLVLPSVAFAESDAPRNVLLQAAFVGTAVMGLLRFNVGIMPQGTRWAANTLMMVGALVLVVFALWARAQSDMKRWVAHGLTAYAGLVLVGIGSCTPQGIAASVYVAATLALVAGLFALLVHALETRVRTTLTSQFGGLSEHMPMFAGLFGVAVFVSMGMPGLVGFWGPLLAVTGAFPRQPGLAVVAIAGMVILAAVQMRATGKILFGAVPAEWRKNKYLEAFGGKFPDLWRDELLVTVPLAVLLLVLGLSPRTLFSLIDAAILDLHRLVDAAGVTQVG